MKVSENAAAGAISHICAAFCLALLPLWLFTGSAGAAGLPIAPPAAQASGEPAQPPITLDPPSAGRSAAKELAAPMANRHLAAMGYRELAAVHVRRAGQSQLSDAQPEPFVFTFHTALNLTGIATKGDFQVVNSSQGGACAEGGAYSAGDKCTVELLFTPKAPGHRTGKLILNHTGSAQPLLTPVGGTAYASAVSFVPALMSTVPSTVNNGVGNFNEIFALAVDGGDTLYVSDYKNNKVSSIDPTGNLAVLAGGGSNGSPTYNGLGTEAQLNGAWGIAADPFGDVFLADNGNKVIRQVDPTGVISTVLGGGANNGSCTHTAPCNPTDQAIGNPTGLATDPNGNLFALIQSGGNFFAELALANETTDDFYYLSSAHLQPTGFYAIAVDSNDDLYYADILGSSSNSDAICSIYGQNQNESLQVFPGAITWPVAGDRYCGYAGDGGPATGAQISNYIGQFAWDAAGDFYFTDTNNQVVRRIDASTGIIHTIAGYDVSGQYSQGYYGPGGPATLVNLWNSNGVAVDSAGNVYVSSEATTSSTVIRKIGGPGQIDFPSTVIGVSSAAQTVLVTDTGSAELNLAHASFSSGNTADFALDPVTTTCSFTTPLSPGQSCNIGVIFKPTAAGTRSAVLTLTDDTIAGNDIIQVSGVAGATAAKAVFTPASLTFPPQLVGTTSAYQTVYLTNTGGLPLGIGALSLPGSVFTGYEDCTSPSLAPGASCFIEVAFSPSAPGPASDTNSVSTSLGVVSFPVTGTGVLNATLSPASISFSPQTLGTTSVAQTVKLINVSLTPINLYGFGVAGSEFSGSAGTCGPTLAANTSCTYTVTFSPTAAQTYSGTLTVATSAGNVATTLTGTGIINMSLSPSTLTFPSTVVGATSGILAFKLVNSATVPLALTGTSIAGSQFNPANTCGASIAAAGTCIFTVKFTPSYVGSIETTLTINTGRGPLSETLIGTGIAGTPAVMTASALNPAIQGETVTLRTTVTGAGKETPTGDVVLKEGTAELATAALVDGKATFELTKLKPGKHILTTYYLGDKLHKPADSSPLDQVVDPKANP